jgi:PAS domain-containing protein
MELRRQGIGGSYETVLRTKDGQEKHAIVSSRPIFEAGDVYKGTFIVGLDITDRKRMEEALLENRQRLELALEGADLGLWDWNIQTGEMIFNKRGAEILGTSLDDLEPNFWSWSKRVHPDDRRRIR